MIILITGASHTGKTVLAQRLLERCHYPYLSIDHLKMGLIRSGQTKLTPCDDEALTAYLWPIVREMIKTAIENEQNLIVEGCYIPFGWEADLEERYRKEMRYLCLAMSESYLENHWDAIVSHANDAEQRLDDSGLSKDDLIKDNRCFLEGCRKFDLPCVLLDEKYDVMERVGGILCLW